MDSMDLSLEGGVHEDCPFRVLFPSMLVYIDQLR